jgi:DNA-binding MarR family transcriptional regulator
MTSQRSIPHLTRLQRRVYANATVEQLGMTSKQLAVLALLRDNGDLPQQSLCGAMQLSQNTVVAWLNELEDMGFIARVRDPDDRRKHNVALTDKGRDALERGEAELRKCEDKALSGLTEHERTQLRNLLAKALETS